MEKKYNVLKKFGALKRGDVFDPTDGYEGTEKDIAEAIEGGFIKEITEEKSEKKEKKNKVTVTYRGGVRHYSLAVHGEDFEALAEEFAKKFDGVIA